MRYENVLETRLRTLYARSQSELAPPSVFNLGGSSPGTSPGPNFAALTRLTSAIEPTRSDSEDTRDGFPKHINHRHNVHIVVNDRTGVKRFGRTLTEPFYVVNAQLFSKNTGRLLHKKGW